MNRTFIHHLPLLLLGDVTEEAGVRLDRPQQGAQETLAEQSYRTHVETGLDASQEPGALAKLDTERNRAPEEMRGKEGGKGKRKAQEEMKEGGPELGASQGRSTGGLRPDRFLGAEDLQGGKREEETMMTTADQGEIELQEAAARQGDTRL